MHINLQKNMSQIILTSGFLNVIR